MARLDRFSLALVAALACGIGGNSADAANPAPTLPPPPHAIATAHAAIELPNEPVLRFDPRPTRPRIPTPAPITSTGLDVSCEIVASPFVASYDTLQQTAREATADAVVTCRNVRAALPVVIEYPSSKSPLFLQGATPNDRLTYAFDVIAGGITDNGRVASVTLTLLPEGGNRAVRRVVLLMHIPAGQRIRGGVAYHGDAPLKITY